MKHKQTNSVCLISVIICLLVHVEYINASSYIGTVRTIKNNMQWFIYVVMYCYDYIYISIGPGRN